MSDSLKKVAKGFSVIVISILAIYLFIKVTPFVYNLGVKVGEKIACYLR